MAIQVGDNFDHKSKKPLDGRISYATLALMKAVADANIYEGCVCYCVENDKYYKFLSTNTVDQTTGKWRELQTGGGGGSSTFADLDDVDLNNLQNGQVPKWNSQTEKWENGNAGGSGGGHTIEDEGVALTQRDTLDFVDFDLEDDDANEKTVVQSHELTQEEFAEIFSTLPTMLDKSSLSNDATNFSLSEKVIGTWVDGKPLYQKTLTGTYNNSQNVDISVADLGIESIMFDLSASFRIQSDGNRLYVGYFFDSSDKCQCYYNKASNCVRLQKGGGAGTAYVTIRYTKTSDSALASGEKIVGTWINGKPIYEKVFDFEGLSSSAGHKTVSISSLNVDRVISLVGEATNPTSHNMLPIPFSSGSASDQIRVCINANNTIDLDTYTSWSGYSECYVIMRYTKTTD